MTIAARSLKIRAGGAEVDVPVIISAPERAEVDWICRFEIGWPEGAASRHAAGTDSVQALVFALQMIGAELYASKHHEAGHLVWMEPGQGYGFPVPNGIRDLLVGDDARYGG
jgi:hypothetical protein